MEHIVRRFSDRYEIPFGKLIFREILDRKNVVNDIGCLELTVSLPILVNELISVEDPFP